MSLLLKYLWNLFAVFCLSTLMQTIQGFHVSLKAWFLTLNGNCSQQCVICQLIPDNLPTHLSTEGALTYDSSFSKHFSVFLQYLYIILQLNPPIPRAHIFASWIHYLYSSFLLPAGKIILSRRVNIVEFLFLEMLNISG